MDPLYRTAPGASGVSFVLGAALPLATAALVPETAISLWVKVLALVFLAVLGAVGARAGGAPAFRAVARVTFWGRSRWPSRRWSASFSVRQSSVHPG